MKKINKLITLILFLAVQVLSFSQTDKANKHANYLEILTPTMVAVKLPGNINSPYQELGPIPSLDGKTIYYSRHHDPKNMGGKEDEDIWFSQWDSVNNHWTDAIDMGAPLNNKYPNFINSISTDGNRMFLGNIYYENGSMGPGISISDKTATGWSFPKALIIGEKAKQPDVSACHSSDDQKILLLAYDHRANGIGGEDIFVSFVQADNNWTEPINLGTKINTKGTETAPFLADDNTTLFFTSDRSGGLGGKDIYVSTRLDETWKNWSEPKNLGPIVNNANDQSFFYISSHFIFFTSEGDKDGNQDIYSIALPQPPKKEADKPAEPITKSDTENKPAEPSTTANDKIANGLVKFAVNECSLDGNNNPELVTMSKYLKDKPSVKIEIAGRADDTGSDSYNLALSKRRTDCVLNYFKSQGIDSKRISVKNYGESKPLANGETEEARAQNRSVEILVK